MNAMNIAGESTFDMGTQRGIGLTGSDIQAVEQKLYRPRLPDKLVDTLDPKHLRRRNAVLDYTKRWHREGIDVT